MRLCALVADSGAATEALAWAGNRHRGWLRANYGTRRDLRRIPVGDAVRIEVFWKDLSIGRGPAASVFLLDGEILRFDCFGPGDGHVHAAFFLAGKAESRLYMPETTVAAQFERAMFEIERNLGYYQARLADSRLRRLAIDPEALGRASQEARVIMQRYAGLV